MVAHACSLSYLEGRDQEDYGSKPVQGGKLARSHLYQQAGYSGSQL
jgi:hypothetical protein